MSRIGNKPIQIPSGVEVKVGADNVTVKGPLGAISTPVHSMVSYSVADGVVEVSRTGDTRQERAQHGLRRSLLANCIEGVTSGYTKSLEAVGVGYKISVQGKNVVLNVGFSHPVNFPLPEGISAKVDGGKLAISGVDKQLVGEVAATMRRVRPPEPYKGKGIKYVDEQIRRKAGKSGKK